jgi:hypothetical protein
LSGTLWNQQGTCNSRRSSSPSLNLDIKRRGWKEAKSHILINAPDNNKTELEEIERDMNSGNRTKKEKKN